MAYKKECVLMDRECIGCGECDKCDLDPSKICDNCCKCIDIDADFKSVQIDEIIDDESVELDEKELKHWKYDEDFIINYSKDADAVEHKTDTAEHNTSKKKPTKNER